MDNQALKALEDIVLKINSEEIHVKLVSDQKLKTLASNRELIQNCIITYKENLKNNLVSIEAVDPEIMESLYHGYPIEGDITHKFKFIEDTDLKLWKLSDMMERIQKIEGPLKADNTLDNIHSVIKKRIEDKTIVSVRFNDTKQYTFYTTRREWLDVTEVDGKQVFSIKQEHMPDPTKIRTLSELEKKIITIKGY